MTNDKNYYDLPDETLVNLTLLGNNKAFESLVIRYQKKVMASAYSITRDHHLAEDVMQNSFVAAWKKLNTLREQNKFGAWICRIAKNNAKNVAVKYQGYIHLDSLENIEAASESAEDYDMLHSAIENLSDKQKSAIKLHYLENASIEEISNKLNLPVGTVKRRLHDGREKIRKELGYMENNSKKIAKSVLEKIEELRIRWRSRESKEGFEGEYKNMLTEIENLPESEEKYFCMADVMQLGLWWIPGEDNDEIVEKIKKAAEKGKNTEILGEIWKREAEKYSGDEKTEYILNTLIPRMEQANMTDALGWEWFWLGYEYYKKGEREKGYAAYSKVMEILPKHHVYHANAISALRLEKLCENVEEANLSSGATGEELFINDGRLYFHKQPGYSKGGIFSSSIPAIFCHASRCDNMLYDSSLEPGESIKSYDGHAELKFVSDNAEIETPCGKFGGCELWNTESPGFSSSVYYKRGIGIVHITTVRTGGQYGKSYCSLKKYHIAGGDGLIPFCEGNRWEYESGFSPDAEAVYEIVSSNDTEVIFAAHDFGVKTYSPDNWEDMILQIRREYWGNNDDLKDVSFQMERAKALADTKYKKAHTAVVADVIKRIFEGDETYTPDGTIQGHWNFFQYHSVRFEDGKIKLEEDRNFAFEWKDGSGTGDMSYHLAVNYFMSIIAGATGCIWSDEWKPGAKMTMKGNDWFKPVTDITVEHLDSVEVAAGRFEDCLKINLDIKGNDGAGWNNFLKGKKEYYYAKGIGLVKGVHHFKDDTVVPNYELTYYEGTGEGYMPIKDGLFRRYAGQGMTDGYVGGAEYTFVEDDSGNLKVLENNIGYGKRKVYSPDSWEDMILQMRKNIYRNDKEKGWLLPDISFEMERAEALALTPYQKKHTAAAIATAKRMKEGDARFTPDRKFECVWNSFVYKTLNFKDGRIISEIDGDYSFSWHMYGDSGDMGYHLIANDLFGVIKDATGCIWSDEWAAGASMKMKGTDYPDASADVSVENAGTVETAAGKFSDVIKITLDVTVPHKTDPRSEVGFQWPQLASRAGKKEYYFAKGIGIVKCVNYLKAGEIAANYELVSYEGTGEGYMPIQDGLTRFYEAMGTTNGYVGKTEYNFCEKNGKIVILENRTGIKI
ncbi:MAG: sigma-70 family RNA polymerase sigma factor [Oscillospiraceae bacterium]|nr:sigma-70 family RNA polymerase sigma factor [Oscillospiraceae bacterium]